MPIKFRAERTAKIAEWSVKGDLDFCIGANLPNDTSGHAFDHVLLLGGWPGALIAQRWLQHKLRRAATMASVGPVTGNTASFSLQPFPDLPHGRGFVAGAS